MRRMIPLVGAMAIVALCAVVVAAVGSGASTGVDPACAKRWWPQPRQNACGNSSVSDTSLPTVATVGRLARAWVLPVPGGVGKPVVWQGRVYVVGGDGLLRAVDLATGTVGWKAKTGGGFSPPLVDGDVLLHWSEDDSDYGVLRRYAMGSGRVVWQQAAGSAQATADGNLYTRLVSARDLQTGTLRWEQPITCWYCGVAAAGRRVYVAGDLGEDASEAAALYALDARTGKVVWTASSKADMSATTPVLAGGRLFVRTQIASPGASSFEGTKMQIEAFRASDGTYLWTASAGTSRGTIGAFMPAANAALVVYPSAGGKLYAFDAATGATRWTMPFVLSAVSGGTPAITNGIVWFRDSANGRIVALDARNGRRLWTSKLLLARYEGQGSPVLAGGTLLLAAEQGLVAYRVGR